jgi:hypothetical protein
MEEPGMESFSKAAMDSKSADSAGRINGSLINFRKFE